MCVYIYTKKLDIAIIRSNFKIRVISYLKVKSFIQTILRVLYKQQSSKVTTLDCLLLMPQNT